MPTETSTPPLVQRLADALEGMEWAATTWTDYATCPFCFAIEEDDHGQHKADCLWVALMHEVGRR